MIIAIIMIIIMIIMTIKKEIKTRLIERKIMRMIIGTKKILCAKIIEVKMRIRTKKLWMQKYYQEWM